MRNRGQNRTVVVLAGVITVLAFLLFFYNDPDQPEENDTVQPEIVAETAPETVAEVTPETVAEAAPESAPAEISNKNEDIEGGTAAPDRKSVV